jgi:hypothetical protein
LIHEAPDRLFLWVRIEITVTHPGFDLVRHQPEWPLASLDLITKEFESLSNVDYSRLLRMKYHIQLLQYLLRCYYRRSRLCRGFTGDEPVVRIPRYLIPLATHFPIKRSQEYVTQNG